MPTTTLKTLYLAGSIGELNNKTKVDVADKSVQVKCNAARKIFTEAENSRKDGDEEKAYIFYMKYYNMIQNIVKSAEYKKNKKYYEDILGKKNMSASIQHAEHLQESLQIRYKILKLEKDNQKIEEIKLNELEQKKTSKTEPNEISIPKEKIVDNANDTTCNSVFNETITSKQLYDLMRDKAKTVLIIDSRLEHDFNSSHILNPSCFNIPENLLKPGITAVTLENQLSVDALRFWNQRDKVDYIIMYDWVESNEDKKLHSLKTSMTKWDTRVTLKHEPLILRGGFESWCLHYPMHTSNPSNINLTTKSTARDNNVGYSLDFSYPDMDDILNSPSQATSSPPFANSRNFNATSRNLQPIFDRSSKPELILSIPSTTKSTDDDEAITTAISAGQLINGSHNLPQINRGLKPQLSDSPVIQAVINKSSQQMQDNLARQDKVMNESLSIERERLEKEKQYNDLVSQHEKDEECSNLQSKEELLLEKIRQLELEKKAKQEEEMQYREENERIKQKLDKVQQQRQEDTKIFEEEKAQIRRKMDERIRLEREVEKLRHDRKKKEKKEKQVDQSKSQHQIQQDLNSKRDVNLNQFDRASRSDSHHSDQQQIKMKPDSSGGDTYMTKLKDEPPAGEGQLGPQKRPSLTRSHSSPNIAQMLAGDDDGNINVDNKIPQVDRTIKPFTKTERKISLQQDDYRLARLRNLMPLYGNQGRALTGLKNLGNTCFMNSIIQCLAQTTALASFFIQGAYRDHINRTNPLGHHGELAEEFAVVIRALWAGQYRSITPRDFKNTVSKYHPMFEGNEQQDSQEFLVFLMDGLHEDLNEVKIRPTLRPLDNDKMAVTEAAEKAWEAHKQHNQSLIVNLFQGQYKSTVKCLHCGKQSITFDTFMYLSLPIPPGVNRCSLKDCLQLFVKEERMTGASKWNCPKCGEKREADKKMDIWKLPRVLLIHLKRFSYEGMWRRKLQTYVDFPLINLDLEGYVLDSKKRFTEYSLYAVSNHYGTMEGGHYTAFCKNCEYDRWYKFDDHEVTEMSSGDVKSSAAYILFYTSGVSKVPQVYE